MGKTFIVIAVSFMVLTIMSASALADELNDSKRNDFNARLEHIACKIQLTKTQLDIFSAVNSNITSYKDVLDADYVKLAEAAAGMDPQEFSRAVFNTSFRSDLQDAVKAIRTAKVDFVKSNITKDEKKNMSAKHKQAIADYANCTASADKNWTEARVQFLQGWINRWEKTIEDMKNEGYNTSEMESVVADAKKKLTPAVQTLANNSYKSARKKAMEDAQNLHLHLWARFQIAKVRSFLSFIEPKATSSEDSAKVTAIKAKLDEAAKLAIAGKKYAPGEFSKVWGLINDASKMTKELFKTLEV